MDSPFPPDPPEGTPHEEVSREAALPPNALPQAEAELRGEQASQALDSTNTGDETHVEPVPPSPEGTGPQAISPSRSEIPAAAAPTISALGQVPTPTELPQYADRSSGLVVFGIIQILLGLFCLLGIPLVLISAVMSRKTIGGTMPAGSYVLTIATYAMLAAMLITLGVGSIRARRWAWAITLIGSWAGLLVGILMTIFLTAVMPATFIAAMKTSGASAAPMSRGVIAVVLTIIIVGAAVFLVVLPAAFVIFYRRKDVQETCKRRDPQERWTDRCPLPVLAVSLLFAYGVVYYLLMSFTAPMIPFFGRWLTGWPGGVSCLLLAGLDIFLAISIYRLKPVGWWIAMVALSLRLLSTVLTFLRGNVFDAYARMGMPQKQLDMMNANPAMRSGVILWSSLVATIAFLGYMVWIKRYFVPSASVGAGVPARAGGE